MIPENVEVAIRRLRTLADSALGSLYEVECQREMRNACILLELAYAAQPPAAPVETDDITERAKNCTYGNPDCPRCNLVSRCSADNGGDK